MMATQEIESATASNESAIAKIVRDAQMEDGGIDATLVDAKSIAIEIGLERAPVVDTSPPVAFATMMDHDSLLELFGFVAQGELTGTRESRAA